MTGCRGSCGITLYRRILKLHRIRHMQSNWMINEDENIARLEENTEHYEKWERTFCITRSVLPLTLVM